MKKILSTTLLLLLLISPQLLHAETNEELAIETTTETTSEFSNFTLYDETNNVYGSGDTVCANYPYYISTKEMQIEVLVLDAKTNKILKVYNGTTNAIEIIFPNNVEEVTLVITIFNDDGTLNLESEEQITLTVEDCGYSQIVEDYDMTMPQMQIDYDGTDITLTEPTNVEDYYATYHFLGQPSKDVKFNSDGTSQIEVTDSYIIQVYESYTLDGEDIEYYFEIEINPFKNTFFIREVSGFEVNLIEARDIINGKLVALLLFLIVLLLVVTIIHRRIRKKYAVAKKEKERNRR